ncbi:MAG: hypothetical protein ABSC92_13250 [Rhizomicrobium sp.]
MKDDLLSASASVNWAVSNFPSFDERLGNWVDENVHVTIKETPPDVPNNVIVAEDKVPLPLEFNAEVGAYINAIRSSLDILATSLVQRYGVSVPEEDVYFPVVRDRETFDRGKYKGHKFVQALPAPERDIVEKLKPYAGGNDLLWDLHRLDILRKHFRLLTVQTNPAAFRITGWGLSNYFTRISTGWACNPGETMLGLVTKNAPHFEMHFTGFIGLNEPGPLARVPVVHALDTFAKLAQSIIMRFDH